DMNEGCPERFDLNLYRFVASYNKRKRPAIYEKLDALPSSKTVIVLSKDEELDHFLDAMKKKVDFGMPPLLHAYDLQWPQDFAAIKGVIEGSMSLIPTDIQHIGSTAVPGLLAKPIIDIDLVYPVHSDFEAIKATLQGLGYRHHGDQGIKGREVFKRIKIQDPHPILDHISHHLYVCHVDNPELERHLIFRDHLIKNEADRNAYGELKQKIAGETEQDRKRYAKRKETMAREFIEKVLAKAQNR
nr:GrpB family protein [Saprospiraceae bacterium]